MDVLMFILSAFFWSPILGICIGNVSMRTVVDNGERSCFLSLHGSLHRWMVAKAFVSDV